MHKITPKISVLIPVYNGEKHIEEAIDSILSQTFTDFECIIIDDGSNDNTWSILEQYQAKDSRIRIIKNEQNMQIAATLNKGLSIAKADLVARMDADDFAYPNRLERQYNFMQMHPEVTNCGTWLETYEEGDLWQYPTENKDIKAHMLFYCCIAHPTVIMRKDIVLKYTDGYRETMPPVEDYDLWARLLINKDVVFANIPEVLLKYRVHPTSDKTLYKDKQSKNANGVRYFLLEKLGISCNDKQFNSHLKWSNNKLINNLQDLYACFQCKKLLLQENYENKFINKESLEKFFKKQRKHLLLRYRPLHYLQKLWISYVPLWVKKKYREYYK